MRFGLSFWSPTLPRGLKPRLERLLRPLGAAALLCAGAQAYSASLLVDVRDSAGKPVADAVVFLESREAKALAKPLAYAEIAQVAKQFVPAVSVVTVGTAVQFPNRDTVRHHVYSFSPAKPFDLKLYTGTPANPVLFDKPGVAILGCNIHDSMAAWVLVLETPYYARSTAAGRASLDNLPPGNYQVRAWHPGMPPGAPAAQQGLSLTTGTTTLSVTLEGARL